MTKLKPRPQTVALLYADDSFDVSVAKGTRELLKKAGLKTVIDERYSTNASDFSVAALAHQERERGCRAGRRP